MDWKKATYIDERKYTHNQEVNQSDEQLCYWKKIIGDAALEAFFEECGFDRKTILNSDDYTYEMEDFKQLENLKFLLFQERGKDIQLPFFKDKKGRLVFDNFYLPLIKLGVYLLRKNSFDTTIFEESFAEVLLERIGKVAMGILMFEMQLNKKEHKLRGKTAKEEYVYYNSDFLGNTRYLCELLDIYPCLGRIMLETIESLVTNYIELIYRLEKDKKRIQTELAIPQWKIKEIKASGSDSHNGGKTVFIICFLNGQNIVYKPRSLQAEEAYQKFCTEISIGCKYQLKTVNILNMDEYGWEQYIEASSCDTNDAVERYYYRFGILIFINYILNANDLHTENVIAQGEYPVIIDAETILDNKREIVEKNARAVINDYIHESVLYSGLLPHYRFERKGKAINMSAINGQEGEEFPIFVPVIKEVGTSNMHYEYTHPVTQANQNLVKIKDKFVEPSKYTAEICLGFGDAYEFVLRKKEHILNFIKIFKNLKVRHLIQDTQRYSMLLHTSVHPYFMQDGKDRNLFLAGMYKEYKNNQGEKDVVKMEINDMLHMDIPYFHLNTSKTSLYGRYNKEITSYFKSSSMEQLREKIKNMNKKEMDEQKRFIKISLTNLDECEKDMSMRQFPISTQDVDKRVIWSAVKKIANILLESAVWGENKEDVNWLGISSIGQRGNTTWNIQPLGNYLYDGIAGISIFFRALKQYTDDKQYIHICDAIEHNLFEYTDEIIELQDSSAESSGVFSGESGIVYTYMVLYQMSKRTKYLEYAKKHSKIMNNIISNDTDCDIIYGNAGAILTMLELYKVTQGEEYLDMAYKAGRKLVEMQIRSGHDEGGWVGSGSKQALTGFSHGAAGIVYALSKLYEFVGDDKIMNAVLKGLDFERSLYSNEARNWIDRRERTELELKKYSCFMTAWCHGSAGILLGRTKMYNYLPDIHKERIKDELISALCSIEQTGFNTNDCLCHGNLGNTEIMLEYAKKFHNTDLKKNCQKIRENIAKGIIENSYDCGRKYLYGYKIPGFMTGVAGMGYSLLRDLDEFPCVLSIEL